MFTLFLPGHFQGVVTDQKSREGLISATVQLIAGDGKINYTSTDLKGMFQF